MERPASFGATVRDRRLALGYSLGQLATKVHKTAASIRAWEKGVAHPDADEVAALAGALDLDEGMLTELLAASGVRSATTTPAVPVADPWSRTNDVPGARDGRPGYGAVTDQQKERLLSAAELSGPYVDDVPDVPETRELPAEEAALGEGSGASPIHEALTEAVPVVAPATSAVAVAEPETDSAGATSETRSFALGKGDNPILQAWDATVAWYRRIFDPNRKWIYRVRIVLLVIAMYVMLRVLGWALSHLWDALQEVFDSISFSPTETPDVAN